MVGRREKVCQRVAGKGANASMKTIQEIHEAIYKLNRDFQQVIGAMDEMRELKAFSHDFLSFATNRLEELRAIVNHRFTNALNGIEGEDAYRFQKMALGFSVSNPAPGTAPAPEPQGPCE